MNIVAIIPARDGSRRIQYKNIKPFCGRPLIAWTIIQALSCKEINGVYVTTDGEEIAEIAEEYGATVHMREHDYESLDTTGGGVPVTQLALKLVESRSVDATVCLFPTSPLRKTEDIPRLIEVYKKLRQQIICCVPIKDAFIDKRLGPNTYRQFIRDKSGAYMIEVGGTDIMPMSYHYRPQLGPSTQVVKDDPSTFTEYSTYPMNFSRLHHMELDWWQAHEIDYQEEFELCEYLFDKYVKGEWEREYERSQTHR